MSEPQVLPDDYFERLEAVELDHWWHRELWTLTRRLLEPAPRGASVLDAGCGTGGNLLRLEQLGTFGRLAGVDLSEEAVRRASSRVPAAELAVAPLRTLPFPDASFQVVMTNDVLQHVPESELAASISELRRVLVQDGLLVLRVNGARVARRERPDWCIFDRDGLAQLLREGGFAGSELSYVNLVGSLLDVVRGRRPRAPTAETSGIPDASGVIPSAIAAGAMRAEASLRRVGVPTPYGHTLLGRAFAAPTSSIL